MTSTSLPKRALCLGLLLLAACTPLLAPPTPTPAPSATPYSLKNPACGRNSSTIGLMCVPGSSHTSCR